MFRLFVVPFFLLSPPVMALAGEGVGEGTAKIEVRGFYGASLDYEEDGGRGRFRVAHVVPGGPAASAGLKAGDMIHEVNGVPFRFTTDLERYEAFLWLRPGDHLSFDVVREDGTSEVVEIIAEAMDPKIQHRWDEIIKSEGRSEVMRKIRAGASIRVKRAESGELELSFPGYSSPRSETVEEFLGSIGFMRELLDALKPGDSFLVGSDGAREESLLMEVKEAPDYILESLGKAVSAHPGFKSSASKKQRTPQR